MTNLTRFDTDTDEAMPIEDLIAFAQRWSELGDAVSEQVALVLEDPDCGNCWEEGTEHGVNPAAIVLAAERLQGLHPEIDALLTEFIDRHTA